ncbi:MAG: PDZ domain-containing protein, partial [Planctomycetota bacterium]|nr:PDZ domain-containing protein [Planctomycetota bacterium]
TPEVRKAWFAAATQVLSKKLAKALGLKRTKGVRLTQIYPDSEVEKAGFQVGDILTHIDGQRIEASQAYDSEVFETMIRAYKIGSTAEFRVIRGGEKMKVASVLSETPKPVRELKVHEDIVLEFKVRDISYFDRIRFRLGKEETGALVTQVQPGGWASMGELSKNHIIQAVEGRPVTDVKSLKKELKRLHTEKPRHVSILVKRGILTRILELEPGWPEKPGEDKPK